MYLISIQYCLAMFYACRRNVCRRNVRDTLSAKCLSVKCPSTGKEAQGLVKGKMGGREVIERTDDKALERDTSSYHIPRNINSDIAGACRAFKCFIWWKCLHYFPSMWQCFNSKSMGMTNAWKLRLGCDEMFVCIILLVTVCLEIGK